MLVLENDALSAIWKEVLI